MFDKQVHIATAYGVEHQELLGECEHDDCSRRGELIVKGQFSDYDKFEADLCENHSQNLQSKATVDSRELTQ